MMNLAVHTQPLGADQARAAVHPGMQPRLARLQQLHRDGRADERYAAWLDAARGWVDLGAMAAAEAHFEQALRWSELLGGADPAVDVMCELAELNAVNGERRERERRGAGRAERRRARAYAKEAARRAAQMSDASCEIIVLLRVSDVLDRCGRRDEALELQVRAVRLMAGTRLA